MRKLLEFLAEAPAATWIAIGSFVVSLAALLLTRRKQEYDEDIAAATKTSELFKKLMEQKLRLVECQGALAKFERKCADCSRCPPNVFELYRKSLELSHKVIDLELEDFQNEYARRDAAGLERKKGLIEGVTMSIEWLTESYKETTANCDRDEGTAGSEHTDSEDGEPAGVLSPPMT